MAVIDESITIASDFDMDVDNVTYDVISPIMHDGRMYLVGETISLTLHEAALLASTDAIAVIEP